MRIGTITVGLVLIATAAYADVMKCGLTEYKAAPGLAASVTGDTLVVTWDGDEDSELRLRFEIDRGTPTIRDSRSGARAASGVQWPPT